MNLDARWRELVTAALLGTDRRPPPPAPAGPVGALVLERGDVDAPARLLDEAAALTVVRRGALRPGPALSPLMAPPTDPRPEAPHRSARHHARIVAEWPVLEDEWLLALIDGGWRLPRELVVPLLVRHRGDPARRHRVERAAGPLAAWLTDHLVHQVPGLAPAGRSPRSAVDRERVEAAAGVVPELPITPDLAAVLSAPDRFGAVVADGFEAGRLRAPHFGVAVNLVARVRPDVLPSWITALDHVHPHAPSASLAISLAELARLRHEMLVLLTPTHSDTPPPTPPTRPAP